MNLPRDVDTNRLAKELEERAQDRQYRIFESVPGVQQLKDREEALYYDGTSLKLMVRYGDSLYTGDALTKL